MNILNIEHVSKIFGEKRIFDDVSYGIHEGDKIGIIGINGTGKTTLLRLIAGLEKADSGKVLVNGRVSVVFQEDRLLEWYTVRQNLELVEKDNKKVDEILKKLDILDVADSMPSTLSGGMKRRVAIARAVAFGGDILLLDEVFNGIDKQRKLKIADYLLEIYKDKTIIAVSHIKEDANMLGAKIFDM